MGGGAAVVGEVEAECRVCGGGNAMRKKGCNG